VAFLPHSEGEYSTKYVLVNEISDQGVERPYIGPMKILFQHKGKVVRIDAKCMTVVYPANGQIAVQTFLDAHTTGEEDATNILRVVNAASNCLLDGLDDEKEEIDEPI